MCFHHTCRVQIAIDIFSMANTYTDLASLSALTKYTCGQLYYYPSFVVQRDGQKLGHELEHNLTRTTGASVCQLCHPL